MNVLSLLFRCICVFIVIMHGREAGKWNQAVGKWEGTHSLHCLCKRPNPTTPHAPHHPPTTVHRFWSRSGPLRGFAPPSRGIAET